jgi:hypothetical protein
VKPCASKEANSSSSASRGEAERVHDIAGNQLVGAASLGQVGLDWQLGGIAAEPPTGAMGSFDNSTAQVVQAMASFGGGSGAADDLIAGVVGNDFLAAWL